MGSAILLFFSVLVAHACLSECFLFDRKTDCLVSEWSGWSEPFGFGTVMRERKVLRYPQMGGKRCPTDLSQEKDTGVRPTVARTAKVMTDNFMIKNTMKRGRTVGQLRDLLIIIDSSGSIGSTDFKVAQDQLARLLGMLCPDPDPFNRYQQAALLEYSSSVKEIFDFNDKKNTYQVQQGVKSMKYMGRSTCTATAFNYARTKMFTPAKGMRTRPDVVQEVLILSDGRSNCGGNAIAAAGLLKHKADVYGLMIGDHTVQGKKELSAYVSTPVHQHLFAVPGYQDLKKLVDHIEQHINQIQCAHFDL